MIKFTFLNQPIKFDKIDEFDLECRMTLSEFREAIKMYIGPDDGHGYYATETEVSNIYVDFDDVKDGDLEDWVTHVCWYNK